jgi:hypothetical protein
MTTPYRFLDTKHPDEKLILTFDFTNGLAAGELLSGVPTVAIAVASGVDPSPASMANGSASIDGTGLKVLVPVQAGLDTVDYLFTVDCPTTNPLKLLTLPAILSVRM